MGDHGQYIKSAVDVWDFAGEILLGVEDAPSMGFPGRGLTALP